MWMTKTKKVLLVDDDREFVSATKELLEAYGYEVLVAYNGASGVEIAKKFRPSLMLLDVMMATDTEGFDVSRKVNAIPELQDLPVILMTGIRKAMNLPYGFEPDSAWLPVKAVLEKPVPPERLIEEVRKHTGES
jgi:two-component system, OmpR family, alkaline phosphatase synthesis response regulator PhoP